MLRSCHSCECGPEEAVCFASCSPSTYADSIARLVCLGCRPSAVQRRAPRTSIHAPTSELARVATLVFKAIGGGPSSCSGPNSSGRILTGDGPAAPTGEAFGAEALAALAPNALQLPVAFVLLASLVARHLCGPSRSVTS